MSLQHIAKWIDSRARSTLFPRSTVPKCSRKLFHLQLPPFLKQIMSLERRTKWKQKNNLGRNHADRSTGDSRVNIQLNFINRFSLEKIPYHTDREFKNASILRITSWDSRSSLGTCVKCFDSYSFVLANSERLQWGKFWLNPFCWRRIYRIVQ